MALRLPSSPTVGQIITFNNKRYTWSGKSWNIYTSAAANANIVAISTEATEKANLALEQSNTVAEVVVSVFVAANAAFDVANVALSTANNATDTWVRDAANSASLLAQAAFEQANTGGGGGGGGTPTIATITPISYDGRSGYTFTLAGTNYDLGTVVDFITANGTTHRASSTSIIDQANLSAVTPIPFYANNSPLSIKVTTSGGSSYTSNNVIQTGGVPIWNTSTGVLYTNAYSEDIQLGDNSYRLGMPVNEDVDAYDPDGQVITYNIVSGSLPPNTALNQITGTITGTLPESLGTDTTYSFQLGAFDQTGNMSIPRLFDIVVKNLPATTDWTSYTVDHSIYPTTTDGDIVNDQFGNYATAASGIYGAALTNAIQTTSTAHIYNLVTGNLMSTITNPLNFNQNFGYDMVMKDDYLIIGARLNNDDGSASSGAVYIYRTNTGDWSDVYLWKKIDNPNFTGTTKASDHFGTTVALDLQGGPYGGWLAVSAPYEDATNINAMGRVWLYRLNGGTDANNVILHNSSGYGYAGVSAFSGIGLAVTGNTLIYSAAVTSSPSYGIVQYTDLITGQSASLANTSMNTNMDYGENLLAGTHDEKGYMIISADTTSNTNQQFEGRVEVYESSDKDHWVGNTSLKFIAWAPNDGTSYGWYGHRMGFDEESGYLAIAWHRPGMTGGDHSGAVDIWDVTTGTKVTTIYNPNVFGTPASDHFGGQNGQNRFFKLGITSRRLFVGATFEDNLEKSSTGVMYVIKAGF